MYSETLPWQANYDESEMPSFELPDVLTCGDGTAVSNKEQWMNKRKPELLGMFRNIMYGEIPPSPDRVAYTVLTEKKEARNGLALRREIRMDFIMNNGMRRMAVMLLYIPRKAKRPVPVAVALTFGGNESVTTEEDITMTGQMGKRDSHFLLPGSKAERWPIDYIMERGYALAICSYHDFFADTYDDRWQTSIYELFRSKEELNGRPRNASAISAWAWGYIRMLDCLQTVPEIDADKALCIGHSRLGKTALWAGVNDERFKVVCVNDSGCGGAALSRRLYGETLFAMFHYSKVATYWFNDEMDQYCRHPEKLPFDQHCLLALVAPRCLCIHSATEDLWADPKGEYLSLHHAGKVFELFGKEPLASAVQPPPDTPVGKDVCYLLRTGKHNILLDDWRAYLDAADGVFMPE
ncbi:MAG: acetylxylan esterase [Lentisphaerae bacterium]|nr:acetylxylan esterase [Lentisphaerota bacterium]